MGAIKRKDLSTIMDKEGLTETSPNTFKPRANVVRGKG